MKELKRKKTVLRTREYCRVGERVVGAHHDDRETLK